MKYKLFPFLLDFHIFHATALNSVRKCNIEREAEISFVAFRVYLQIFCIVLFGLTTK